MADLCINCKVILSTFSISMILDRNEFGDWVCRRFNVANDGNRRLCATCFNDLVFIYEREIVNVPGPSNARNVPNIEIQALGIDESSCISGISLHFDKSLLARLSPSTDGDVEHNSNDSSPSSNDGNERVSESSGTSQNNVNEEANQNTNAANQHEDSSDSNSSNSLAQYPNGNVSRSTSDSAEH